MWFRPRKTSPKNQEKNYCKSGYFPTTDEEDNNICSRCITTDNVHPKAKELECNEQGNLTTIKETSKYKCKDDDISYYDETKSTCEKCSENMKLNLIMIKIKRGSQPCICKREYLENGKCVSCKGENIKYNEKLSTKKSVSKCKCVIDENSKLPDENAILGTCFKNELEEGEKCELKCRPRYKATGGPVECNKNSIDFNNFKCVSIDDEKNQDNTNEETTESSDNTSDESSTPQPTVVNQSEQEDVVEGFKSRGSKSRGFMSITPKRLFLLFLLIILILNVI